MAGQIRAAAQSPIKSASNVDHSEQPHAPKLGETLAFAPGAFPQLPAGQRWEPKGDDPFERGKLMATVLKDPKTYPFGETLSFDTRFGLPGLPDGKKWSDRGADPFEGGRRMFMVMGER